MSTYVYICLCIASRVLCWGIRFILMSRSASVDRAPHRGGRARRGNLTLAAFDLFFTSPYTLTAFIRTTHIYIYIYTLCIHISLSFSIYIYIYIYMSHVLLSSQHLRSRNPNIVIVRLKHVRICSFQVNFWNVGCWNNCETTLWMVACHPIQWYGSGAA